MNSDHVPVLHRRQGAAVDPAAVVQQPLHPVRGRPARELDSSLGASAAPAPGTPPLGTAGTRCVVTLCHVFLPRCNLLLCYWPCGCNVCPLFVCPLFALHPSIHTPATRDGLCASAMHPRCVYLSCTRPESITGMLAPPPPHKPSKCKPGGKCPGGSKCPASGQCGGGRKPPPGHHYPPRQPGALLLRVLLGVAGHCSLLSAPCSVLRAPCSLLTALCRLPSAVLSAVLSTMRHTLCLLPLLRHLWLLLYPSSNFKLNHWTSHLLQRCSHAQGLPQPHLRRVLRCLLRGRPGGSDRDVSYMGGPRLP